MPDSADKTCVQRRQPSVDHESADVRHRSMIMSVRCSIAVDKIDVQPSAIDRLSLNSRPYLHDRNRCCRMIWHAILAFADQPMYSVGVDQQLRSNHLPNLK